MVSTKNVAAQDKSKNKEKSPSPKPFKEPEGMVTVDLNSGEYNRLDEESIENSKCKHNNRLKYWIRVCCMIGVMFLGISSFIFIMVIDKEYNFFKNIPKKINYNRKYNTHAFHVSNYLSDQGNAEKMMSTTEAFKEKLMSGTYLQDFENLLASCKFKKTLEDCCDIFASETDLIELKEFCTVNDILNIILEHEDNLRLKRNIPEELTYHDYQQSLNGGKLLPLVKDVSEHIVKSELPAIYDRVNNYLQYPQNEGYNDYGEEHPNYRSNYEPLDDFNDVGQFQNGLDYYNQENYADYDETKITQPQYYDQPENNNPTYAFRQPVSYPELDTKYPPELNQASENPPHNFIQHPESTVKLNTLNSNVRESTDSNKDKIIIKSDDDKHGNYPFNVKSSIEVSGIKGENKTLEINLENAFVDLSNDNGSVPRIDNTSSTVNPSLIVTGPDQHLKLDKGNPLSILKPALSVIDQYEHQRSIEGNNFSFTTTLDTDRGQILNRGRTASSTVHSIAIDAGDRPSSHIDNLASFTLNPPSTVINQEERLRSNQINYIAVTTTRLPNELPISPRSNSSSIATNPVAIEQDQSPSLMSHKDNISLSKVNRPLPATIPYQRLMSPENTFSSITPNPALADKEHRSTVHKIESNTTSSTVNPPFIITNPDQRVKSQIGNPSILTPNVASATIDQGQSTYDGKSVAFTISSSNINDSSQLPQSNEGKLSSLTHNQAATQTVTENTTISFTESSIIRALNARTGLTKSKSTLRSPTIIGLDPTSKSTDANPISSTTLSAIIENPDQRLGMPDSTLVLNEHIEEPDELSTSQKGAPVLNAAKTKSVSVEPMKSDRNIFSNRSIQNQNKTSLRIQIADESKQIGSNVTTSYKVTSNTRDRNQLRENQGDSDFRSKSKLDTFSNVNEDIQTNHQSIVNPCFYPYMGYPSPYKVGSPFDGNQMMRIVPNTQSQKIQQSMYVLNPPMYYSYPQQPPFVPNYYPPIVNQQPSYNSPIHASGPGGQYYLCNPIATPTNNIAGMQGVEIRRESFNLQDLVEEMEEEPRNLTKTKGLICSIGEQACADNSKCISNHLVCDNEVQCADGSDELFCSCKERVGKLRACDGYCDCPDCNDELGCFGCKEDEFSCDDWSRFRRSKCIPHEHRCDNIRQCEVTGKDEEDCSVLADHIGNLPPNKISNSVGFLHRNFKGKWYPTCFGTETWAAEVCKAEAGPSLIIPQIHMVLNKDTYEGDYINILPNNEVSLVGACVQDRAAFVECPPIFCGLRMLIKNPYRAQEVDTSIEDMINEMERAHILTQSVTEDNNIGNDSENVGLSRVVGGKPSQPGAWPWLVAIYKNGIFHCGGVLINEMWVATAAHCVDRYWLFYYEVQAGILRRFSFSPMDQTRWVTVAIAHEKYNKMDLNHDIALVKLSSPVRYNKYVRPICLPSETTAGLEFLQGPSPGTVCTTVGWGATVEHGADPDHMREVEIPIMNHCKHKEDLDSNEICAGLSEGGKDACQGDSGGPFMCRNPNNPNQWYLAGIVSHGEGCARPHEPGVYTRVSKYVGWIAENLKDSKFHPRIPLQKCPGYICKVINRCLPKKRRCDKIVDCLLGDDEEGCNNHSNDIFKHNKRIHAVESSRGPEDFPKSKPKPDLVEDILDKFDNFIPEILDSHTVAFDETEEMNSRNSKSSKNENGFSDVSRSSFFDSYFKCKILLQIKPKDKRCNRMLDCEDGTDEADCKCVDYIRNIDPKSVCDGIVDCADGSDEINCVKCSPLEYQCRRSQTCIPLSKHCNGVYDCIKEDDEMDCYTLTDGSTLNLDSDLRPDLTTSGVITINRFGVWKPFCNANMSNNEASVATNVCNLLGFEEYIAYHKFRVADKELKVTMDGFQVKNGVENDGGELVTCAGLYVKCSNITLHSSIHDINKSNTTTNTTSNNSTINSDRELYKLPWFSAIYSDGEYKCMGTVLDATRIVTSINCFDGITMLKSHYVVALLGKGKFHLSVQGPYEQIIRIVDSKIIENTDIIVLETEKNITFTRYVRTANLEARRDGHRLEKCITAGVEEEKLEFVRLNPLKPCPVGHRCFERKDIGECKNNYTSPPWSGVIVCDSGSGWYPAAVYHEENGFCGLILSIKKYTSIKYHKNQILKALQENGNHDVDRPFCNGFLCDLGQCIHKNKTCDGIADCANSEDEKPDLCYEKERACHLANNCVCPTTHLKCNNQKCIPKSAFCDRTYDCPDQEDEPAVCTCKNYLKLTNPGKICDGVLNCLDKTDEDPDDCPCRSESFVCGKTSKCVPPEMVCDGYKDCPNGEDESSCLSLKTENNERTNAGEVMTRTSGVWHSGCFDLNYTTSKLETICEKLGYESGSATQLSPPRNVSAMTAMRPESDLFDVVWIRRKPENKFRLRIRTGNDPFVKFKKDESCYRLFIACI